MAYSNIMDDRSDEDAVDITEPAPDITDAVEAVYMDDGVAAPPAVPPAVESVSLADEVARLNDQYLRLQADFDNYRKRVVRDEAARARRANERLVTELLPVLDHFEMGLQAARAAGIPDAVYTGLALVLSQLMDVLKREGVVPVETTDTEFNPQCHECVVHQPSLDIPENKIIAETRRGWWLGEYLLRPAQVLVSSGRPCVVNDAEHASDGCSIGTP